jgi:hypothetical protein
MSDTRMRILKMVEFALKRIHPQRIFVVIADDAMMHARSLWIV